MQAEQSRVGNVLSSSDMCPPIEGSFSTRYTFFPDVGVSQGGVDAGDAAADDQDLRPDGDLRLHERLVQGDPADRRGDQGLGLLRRVLRA